MKTGPTDDEPRGWATLLLHAFDGSSSLLRSQQRDPSLRCELSAGTGKYRWRYSTRGVMDAGRQKSHERLPPLIRATLYRLRFLQSLLYPRNVICCQLSHMATSHTRCGGTGRDRRKGAPSAKIIDS